MVAQLSMGELLRTRDFRARPDSFDPVLGSGFSLSIQMISESSDHDRSAPYR